MTFKTPYSDFSDIRFRLLLLILIQQVAVKIKKDKLISLSR